MASIRSLCLTLSLPSLTASRAASLTILAISAPAQPDVPRAICFKSISSSVFTALRCTLSISSLPLRSGLSTTILRSKRPGLKSAWSRTSGLFVAPITTIPFVTSNPSISLKSWFNVCSRSSFPIVPSRLLPMASISSINMIQGALATASLNKSLTLDAPTPTNISTKFEPLSE